MKAILLFLIFSFSTTLFALEVDDKLTLRILKTSSTAKTILVNRGVEDGLNVGDHAKFFTSTGVVARGVIIKASPGRTVWSVYRLVNADFIKADTVMKLKITPPVKITEDESKMLVKEDVPRKIVRVDPENLGIPLADGARDLPKNSGLSDAQGMSESEFLRTQGFMENSLEDKNYEVWATLNVSNLSSQTETESGGQSFTGNDVYTQFTFGGEYYAKNQRMWWSRFSPILFVNSMSSGFLSFQGANQTKSLIEFGAGLNWHPWSRPTKVGSFIPFFTIGAATGQVSGEFTPGSENFNGQSNSADGSTFSVNIGGGFKFYSHKGYGARMVIDYYSRNDTYAEDVNGNSWVASSTGPRVYMGLSYRF